MHLQASYTYLDLSFYFDDVALESVGRFSGNWPRRSTRAPSVLKMQNQCGGRPLFQEEQKPRQYEWGKTQDAVGAAVLAEKNLKQTLENLPALGCAPAYPRLCDFRESRFRESRFREKQVKLIKKMGDHVTNLRRPAGPQAGLDEYLFERLTFQNHQEPPEPSRL
ncbi:ferritin light chain-like [Lagenorhynchus albirostris]|uniref:ferritin light chain-like n=1 Tax=Lagenorhynchus albirostris TaxID=27610 RepID=UPI0028EEFA19|nr:ferritin light chain-like [Lagenorhynchus albirostris]